MSQENVELVRQLVEAFNRRDLAAMSEMFDPEIEWTPGGPAAVERAVYRGRDAVSDGFTATWETWEVFRLAEVEGLAIAEGPDASYLIASSQGNSSFVVYRRPDDAYVKTFTVEAANGVDAVEESDGIDVTTAGLGEDFPNGLLVVHDGSDDVGRTNFKLVSLSP